MREPCAFRRYLDLSVVGTKLESDKGPHPRFYDLLHVELGHAMDKVEMGASSTQGGTAKALLAVLSRGTSKMVKSSINSFCGALVNSWNAICVKKHAEMERASSHKIEPWTWAKGFNFVIQEQLT